jgi:alpha-glucosidase
MPPNTPIHWTDGLHHDGSSLYVSNPLPAFAETVTVWLRAPVDAPIHAVFLRSFPNGENHYDEMKLAKREGICAWWTAELHCTMPSNPYHFKLLTGEGAYYYKANGVSRAHSPDVFDFRLLTDFEAPAWLADSVFYQIFPDRFYNGDPSNDVPPGAWERNGYATSRREWGAPPLPYKDAGNVDFYGGDLNGIQEKIDYLCDLGVNALYLNPIFTSHTNHRYDTMDFYHVDPHLGGDDALIALRNALSEAEIRLVLDVTPNHCSFEHPWFKAAQADANAPSADYFTFYERPNNYEAWFGDHTLPKLNYNSPALREVMYGGQDAVLRHWLRDPYKIDGWRLDVQNMVGRQGRTQMGNKMGRHMRAAVKSVNAQAYLMGENFHDATQHLQGKELDAVMNYQGFNMPVRRWLAGYDYLAENGSPAADPTLLPAEAMVAQWQNFRAAIPWIIVTQQFNQLCSHDTARILRVLNGDTALLKLGVLLLMTYPGVPCVYYGDEIGMDGGHDPDNRRCMRWDEATWDHDLRQFYQRMIGLRRTSHALIHGGYQTIHAEGGLVVYQRQSREQQLVIVGYRGPGVLLTASIPVRHAGIEDGAALTDQLSGQTFQVHNGMLELSNLEPGAGLLLEV